MASNLRVDNIQPSTGMGIGIGTANGSVTFNADVTGGLNVTTGLVGVGTDNPSRKLHVHSGSTDTAALFYSSDAGCYINYQDSTSGAGSGVNIGCSGDDIRFGSGAGGEYGRITSAGNFQIANGNLVFPTSGTGIDFSATSDASGMTSELLDDYEEGTWTPGLQFSSSQVGSFTYSGNNGARYTKIGRVVHVHGLLEWTNHNLTSGSALQLTGLPFTSANSNPDRSGISISYAATPLTGISVYQQAFRSEASSTVMTHNYSNATDGDIDNVPNYTQVSTSGAFIFFGMYIV